MNVVFASTESVLVEKIRAHWLNVLLIGLVIVLVIAIVAFTVMWRRKTIPRPVYEMDDDEIVSLLRKTQSNQLLRNPLDSDNEVLTPVTIDRMIRCSKCGFTNPPSSTVCRDCNSLLQGNDYFTSLSRKVY